MMIATCCCFISLMQIVEKGLVSEWAVPNQNYVLLCV